MDQLTSETFRYPLPTQEDLPFLSRLAYRISATECAGCRNYHVAWPYLRSLGANGGGPEFGWREQLAALAEAAAGRRHVRWFLAGSADAGQLAMVAEAMRAHPEATYDVTIVDRCATPLALCREHASAASIALDTVKGELENYVADDPFDIVIMHHTIVFVPEARCASFLKHASGWLAPDGHLVMTLSIDPPGSPPPTPPNPAVNAWRERIIREAARDGELDLPEDIDIFIERTTSMRDPSRGGARTHRAETYHAALAGAGLAVRSEMQLLPDPAYERAAGPLQRDRFMLVATLSRP